MASREFKQTIFQECVAKHTVGLKQDRRTADPDWGSCLVVDRPFSGVAGPNYHVLCEGR